MKKRLRGMVLAVLLVGLFYGVAGAAGNTSASNPSGICDIVIEDGFESVVSLTPQRVDGTAADITTITTREATKEIYAEAVKLSFTYSGAVNGSQYLALVLDDEQAAQRDGNVAFIDQAEAVGQTVSFSLYPKALVNGKNYSVYLSSDAGTNVTALTKVASFQYYAPYVLGDVNNDGKINARDMQRLYTHLNGTNPLDSTDAADVNRDGKVNARDMQRLYTHLNGTNPLN